MRKSGRCLLPRALKLIERVIVKLQITVVMTSDNGDKSLEKKGERNKNDNMRYRLESGDFPNQIISLRVIKVTQAN